MQSVFPEFGTILQSLQLCQSETGECFYFLWLVFFVLSPLLFFNIFVSAPVWNVCFQGVNLAQAKDKGQLIFLEGLKESLSVLIPQAADTGSQAMSFLRYGLKLLSHIRIKTFIIMH